LPGNNVQKKLERFILGLSRMVIKLVNGYINRGKGVKNLKYGKLLVCLQSQQKQQS
jgi:hypothetical protein